MTFAELFSSVFTTIHAEEAESTEPVATEVASKESAADEPVDDSAEVEEEPEDPKPAIMEAALETKQCTPLKHHLDECTQRVEEGSHENCVEEFFHLMHCQDKYAAPKIFAKLK